MLAGSADRRLQLLHSDKLISSIVYFDLQYTVIAGGNLEEALLLLCYSAAADTT